MGLRYILPAECEQSPVPPPPRALQQVGEPHQQLPSRNRIVLLTLAKAKIRSSAPAKPSPDATAGVLMEDFEQFLTHSEPRLTCRDSYNGNLRDSYYDTFRVSYHLNLQGFVSGYAFRHTAMRRNGRAFRRRVFPTKLTLGCPPAPSSISFDASQSPPGQPEFAVLRR